MYDAMRAVFGGLAKSCRKKRTKRNGTRVEVYKGKEKVSWKTCCGAWQFCTIAVGGLRYEVAAVWYNYPT